VACASQLQISDETEGETKENKRKMKEKREKK
jgi:hypothetical protein